MNYCIVTEYWDYKNIRNASAKGRDDIHEVWRRVGCEMIRIPSIRAKQTLSPTELLNMQLQLPRLWRTSLSHVGDGDTLVVHTPPSEKFLAFPEIIKELKQRGTRIITIIYDLESIIQPNRGILGNAKNLSNKRIESRLFDLSDQIICHSNNMKSYLVESGIPSYKISCLNMFDYLTESNSSDTTVISESDHFSNINSNNHTCFNGRGCHSDGAIIIAGDLSPHKAGYLNHLPESNRYHLYGRGYEGKSCENIKYMGVFKPDELLDELDGAYGLIWDGSSIDCCNGMWGNAIKTHIQHKAALILASGRPLIVWSQSAIREYIEERGCGLVVDNLNQLHDKLSAITDDEYNDMKEKAERVGLSLRSGENTTKLFTMILG